ncbi:MAG: hypothetical protein GWN99_06580 [Gemmatimonadetes bacterium]|uniref:Uncharacterized protein n=1 Tax=Candidatus Kutchimonas denitrificans TaxID=3056748 RepID=A0AAE4Z609_9BACT|nr:hypothetical protein [Gemmatimonadota bacterium]NIR73678.1 hypothetical protein [Candidatus Kutchimonas denitrificans]NIS00728.1 hypothetical protein [Gemmatimonadota bacterium]NIT66315.1 hypothetical protein [Gemmatimonadota bacterium]NIU51533.1 hypothetical protein [Gemmatimonadota bacterium]
MDIKPNRLVHLGYGKYWRSDQISGLVPIEDERGPGRRTHVHVMTLSEPIVASRSEEAIRRDMAVSEEEFRAGELRNAAADLVEELEGLSPVLARMLHHEGGLDLRRWEGRLRALLGQLESDPEQEDLFGKR